MSLSPSSTAYLIFGLLMSGISSCLTSLNFWTTILNLRSYYLTLKTMPLFPWALLTSFCFLINSPWLSVFILIFFFLFHFNFLSSILCLFEWMIHNSLNLTVIRIENESQKHDEDEIQNEIKREWTVHRLDQACDS